MSVIDALGRLLQQGGNDIGNAISTGAHDVGQAIDTGVHDVSNFFNGGNNKPIQQAPVQSPQITENSPINTTHLNTALAMSQGRLMQTPTTFKPITPVTLKPQVMAPEPIAKDIQNPIAKNPITTAPRIVAPKPIMTSQTPIKLGGLKIAPPKTTPQSSSTEGGAQLNADIAHVPVAGWLYSNVAEPFGRDIAKFANQGVQEGKQLYDTGRMELANATHNPTAFRNANLASQNNYSGFNNNGGLFHAGTITTQHEAQTGNTHGAEKILGDTLAIGSMLIPGEGALSTNAVKSTLMSNLGENELRNLALKAGVDATEKPIEDVASSLATTDVGKEAAQSLIKASTPFWKRSLANAGIGALTGGTYGVGNAMLQGGNAKHVAESALLNAGFGGAIGGLGTPIWDGTKWVVGAAKNKLGSIGQAETRRIATDIIQNAKTPTELAQAFQDPRVHSIFGKGVTEDMILNHPEQFLANFDFSNPKMLDALKTNANIKAGAQDAQNMVAMDLLKQAGEDPNMEEAVHRAGTDIMTKGTTDEPITPEVQAELDKNAQIARTTRQILTDKNGTRVDNNIEDETPVTNGPYQAQIVEKKATDNGERTMPGVGEVKAGESKRIMKASGQTAGGEKSGVFYMLRDGNGEEHLFQDKTVYKADDPTTIDHHDYVQMDAKEGEKPATIEKADKQTGETRLSDSTQTLRRRLRAARQAYNAVDRLRVKGGTVTRDRLNTLFKRIDTLIDKKNSMGLETAGEENRLAKYTDEMKTWSKVYRTLKPTKTNQDALLSKLGDNLSKIEQHLNDVEADYKGIDLSKRTVQDENGRIYNVRRAADTEIAPHADITYSHMGKFNQRYRLLEAANARNNHEFMVQLKSRPDFGDYFKTADQLSDAEKKKFVSGKEISPEFQGYMVRKNAARVLKQVFKTNESLSGPERILNAVQSPMIQAMVFNPFIHGQNLFVQAIMGAGQGHLFNPETHPILGKLPTGPLGAVRMVANSAHLMVNSEERNQLLFDYLMHGGHTDAYGSEMVTALSKATHGASQVNARSMGAIDTNFRLSVYKELLKAHVNPTDAVREIDNRMGSRSFENAFARNMGLFWKWNKTQGKSILDQTIRHPLHNMGANVNAIMWFVGINYGLNKALQATFGNKVGNPIRKSGELGLLSTFYHLAQDAYRATAEHQGWGGFEQEAVNTAETKVSPIVGEGVQQLASKNLYTGQPIGGVGNRLFQAASVLPEAQYLDAIKTGKKSVPEALFNALTGGTLTHAKGSPATTNPAFSFLNTKGAKLATPFYQSNFNYNPTQTKFTKVTAPGGSPQETDYYTTKDNIAQYLSGQGNVTALNAFNTATEKNRLKNGKLQQNNPSELKTIGDGLGTPGNEKAVDAYALLMRSEGDNNPVYSAPTALQQTYWKYQSMYKDSSQRASFLNEHPELQKLLSQEATYFTNNPFKSPDAPNPRTPIYPTFSGVQANAYNYYESHKNSWTSAQKAQFLQNNPLAASALGAIENYLNEYTVAQGGLAKKSYINLTPGEQSFWNQLMSLPAKTGARTAFINTNPQLYNKIQNVLAQNTILGAAELGGMYQYAGNSMTPQQLQTYYKDLYNTRYDMAKLQAMNGQTSYSLNPALAYSQSKTSTQRRPRKPIEFEPYMPKPHAVYMKYPKEMRLPRMVSAKKITLKKGSPLHKQAVLKHVHIGG